MISEIINLFTDEKSLEELIGGQGESFKVGNIVFKPVYEEEKYIWHAKELESIEFKRIQYSKPIKSKFENYVEESYGATLFIPGDFYEGKLEEKIQAANDFNSFIKDIKIPKNFNKWVSPWTKAQDVAWGVISLPETAPLFVKEKITEIERLKMDLELSKQLIHCDYAGNILFNEKGPIIIDFSPGYYPHEYSIVCLVVDSIAWHNSRVDDLKLLKIEEPTKTQLIIRAVIFRLLVPYFFDPDNIDLFRSEYESFLPIIEWLKFNN